VGRRETADLILASGQVSGLHAEFIVVGIRLFVRDLNSTNGTYVNGRRISHHDFALRHGDHLRMADVEFVVLRRRPSDPAADTTVLSKSEVDELREEPLPRDPASIFD
jgi:pSer/pThr/pTyr-binding forkhead associated (FHA) protein